VDVPQCNSFHISSGEETMSDQIPVQQVESSSSVPQTVETSKKKRGFAVMDQNQVREFGRRGGVAAHRAGTAHEFNSDEARSAGRKGGLASRSSERRLAVAKEPGVTS
jgi:general stress protein YciG